MTDTPFIQCNPKEIDKGRKRKMRKLIWRERKRWNAWLNRDHWSMKWMKDGRRREKRGGKRQAGKIELLLIYPRQNDELELIHCSLFFIFGFKVKIWFQVSRNDNFGEVPPLTDRAVRLLEQTLEGEESQSTGPSCSFESWTRCEWWWWRTVFRWWWWGKKKWNEKRTCGN